MLLCNNIAKLCICRKKVAPENGISINDLMIFGPLQLSLVLKMDRLPNVMATELLVAFGRAHVLCILDDEKSLTKSKAR